MSRGDLQEMEIGTKQSKTAVNAGAKSAEPMPKLTTGIPDGQTGNWEDLGGPTPENYRSDDDSAKLNTAEKTLMQVKDIVNRGAKPADPMKGMKEDSEIDEDDVIIEEKGDEDEDENENYEDMKTALEKQRERKKEKKENQKKSLLDRMSAAAEKLGEEVEEEYDEDDDDKEEDEDNNDEEELDIEEDVNALLTGEELSEEFKDKAKLIFESALRTKISEIKESLEVNYAEVLSEQVEEIKEALTERVDSYLEYVSDEWMTENQLAVERGIKEELTESFLIGMKNLFEDHYVQIPEEKYDVLHSMVEKLDDMETKLNEQIEKNVFLNKRLAESVADGIFDEISEGLALSQKEKLASLAESVEFESDEEYREKLETLREAYFPSRVISPSAKTETLSEGVDSTPEEISGSMAAYLKTLSGFSK
jgi:hypothetical protein